MPINEWHAGMLAGVLTLASPSLAQSAPLQFEFDAGDFSAPTIITNDYWGLRLGASAAAYFAEATDGCEVSESMVTGIVGPGFFAAPYNVQAVVVHDREWLSEECDGNYTLIEDTNDWFAQDDAGKVWYLGEDTTAWDDEQDCLTHSGSWKAGDGGAIPGVVMLAEPKPGVSYQQEFYEGEAEDQAKILRLNAAVSIDFGDYAGCLLTKEYTPLTPGDVEHKFYCSVAGGAPGLTLVNELKEKTNRVEYVGTSKPPGSYAAAFPTSDACAE
jgi:hypothetical protein